MTGSGGVVTVGTGGVGGVIGVPVAAAGVAVATHGAGVTGTAVANIVGEGKYSDLPEPRNVGDGKKTTPAQRKRILEENKRQNGGELRSDGDGRPLNPPQKSQKGKKADMNQAEVDHIDPRSNGGSNSNSNQQVLSKEENLRKSNRVNQ